MAYFAHIVYFVDTISLPALLCASVSDSIITLFESLKWQLSVVWCMLKVCLAMSRSAYGCSALK